MMKFFMALKSALDAECKHVYAICPSIMEPAACRNIQGEENDPY